MKLNYRLILASQSPRRRELMGLLDIPFEIAPVVDIEETWPKGLPVEEVPEYLAGLKADAYYPGLDERDLLITADTVVILGGDIIGKPKDEDDARKMLARMSGIPHKVITGVALTSLDRQERFSVESIVDFAPLTPSEIDYYVSRYHPVDKAGAYGIQEWIGAVAVRSIQGSFYNVMGLPVHQLYHRLAIFG